MADRSAHRSLGTLLGFGELTWGRFSSIQVVWRTLKAPQGLLGGIGRRVSTLIWGGGGAGGPVGGGGVGEAKLVQVVGAAPQAGGDEKSVFVLTASHLQRWATLEHSPSLPFHKWPEYT